MPWYDENHRERARQAIDLARARLMDIEKTYTSDAVKQYASDSKQWRVTTSVIVSEALVLEPRGEFLALPGEALCLDQWSHRERRLRRDVSVGVP